jgi:hypothetical protein
LDIFYPEDRRIRCITIEVGRREKKKEEEKLKK